MASQATQLIAQLALRSKTHVTGFPFQVSFAHQLEKSNLGAIKVWNLEPQTEKVTQKLRTFEEIFFQNPDLKIEK